MRGWLIAGIMLLTSCDVTEVERPTIRLSLSLSAEEITAGETMMVRVVARNITDAEQHVRVMVISQRPYCVFAIQLLDVGADSYVLPRTCNQPGPGPYPLAPGDSIVEVRPFNGMRAGAPLAEGDYHVVASIPTDPGYLSNEALVTIRH